MNTDDLYDFYLHRDNNPVNTKADAEETIRQFLDMFEQWDDNMLAALWLDLGMVLASKRGTSGRKMLLDALTAFDELTKHHSEHTRRMN